MVTMGGVVSEPVPVPVTIAEMVPPLAVKLRFVLTVVVVVGVNRTFTAWVAPTPPRVNGLPDTTLKGAATDADPETVPPPVSDTRSEEHTSELQSRPHLVCRLLLEKKKDQRRF